MQKLFLSVVAALLFLAGSANNVNISNVSILNNGPDNIQVVFDISWENSWRTNVGPNNYDGVWVFFKYKTAGGNWTHLTMTGSDNVLPGGAEIYQATEALKTGAMIYREAGANAVGKIAFTGVKLGVISTLPYDIDVKGFAIEMVYIPVATARPYFGDGNGTNESLNAFHYANNTATTSSVIPMFTDANNLDDGELSTDGIYVYWNDTIQTTNPIGTLDPFPALKALWCMKYEISQAAYRDFLNTLTYSQQVARTAVAPGSPAGTRALAPAGAAPLPYRNSLKIGANGVNPTTPAVYGCDANDNNVYNEPADGEWVACNYLSWQDVAAFLDWSGLAPMSELQYERICRGTTSAGAQPAIYQEFAWGTSNIYSNPYTLSNTGTSSEVITNVTTGFGNAAYNTTSGNGPLRSGIFATASSTRISSGAALYGVMEMTGNVYEYCITLGNVAGRSVRLVPNGNGILADDGNARLTAGGSGYWPGMEGNITASTANACIGTCEVTGNAGLIRRGGSFSTISSACAIAYRPASIPVVGVRDPFSGGRGILNIR